MNDRLKRPDETLLEGSRRVAINAVYDARNANGTMHDAGAAAAEAAMLLLVTDLRAMLHPEHYPGYDPDHVFWDGRRVAEPDEVFEWDSETIEWVDIWINDQLESLERR